jgi:hypothetical protein
MGLRLTSTETAREMLDAWLSTAPDPGEAANIASLETVTLETATLDRRED